MPQFTVLQREHLVRAESDSATIERFKLCGYLDRGRFDAASAEDAVAQYQATDLAKANSKKATSPILRKMLWLGGVLAILWFSFLAFGLLPLAF